MESKLTKIESIQPIKAPLVVPESALRIHEQIVGKLKTLVALPIESPLLKSFRMPFNEVLSLFDKYQFEIVKHSQMKRSCSSGCSCCCWHWVEDVNSFEVEIIADYIETVLPEKVEDIISKCHDDYLAMARIEEITLKKIEEVGIKGFGETIDSIDLILSSYYQLQRPCPLLDTDGSCMVYPVRPLTCRIYMSFSSPKRCHPEYINEGDIPTYLCDLEEEASSLIDELHFKFIRFDEDTGLRSLLLKTLSESSG